ncbi:unnamed protein product [marine sediment metagenome]|uniref:Uncharacterized protein n=1 Tax=marine sediment metagenome TaxID=412755 RepID=X0X882_9ZZZZ
MKKILWYNLPENVKNKVWSEQAQIRQSAIDESCSDSREKTLVMLQHSDFASYGNKYFLIQYKEI